MNIGESIQAFRKQKNLRQTHIADQCGITTTYLSQIENNKKDPTIATLKKICKAMDIPLPILLMLSINVDDIPQEKKESFKFIMPSIKQIIEDAFTLS